MREDLELYYKLLKTAMVELINKDYADFVNLSTNLVSRCRWTNANLPLGVCREIVLRGAEKVMLVVPRTAVVLQRSRC